VVTLAATSLLVLVFGAQQPGTPGGEGLALLAAKALVAELDGRQVVDQALVLVSEGKIEAVAARSELEIPAGYVVRDLGLHWIMPGLVDLHTHVSGSGINDTVYQINSGLRVAPTTVPANPRLKRALAAGVTTVLYIPGSGSNMGGQGILMKTGFEEYERALVRDPGSLKIAQGDNPTRWGYGMGRLLMNYHLRKVIEQGLAYARAWDAFEAGTGDRPERDLRLDIFRDLAAHRTQVSTHTQYFQLVMMSILMLARDYDLDVYIDHGSFDSYLNTGIAVEHNVAAILGPREVMWPSPPRFRTDGQVQGSAWGFQQQGHPMIGFNTDAPVVPLEELPLQGAMGARYGMDNSAMQVVRGLTIVPATVAGIGHRLGSLEPGKDADLVVLSGDPADPRTSVEQVYLEGERVYDTAQNRRRW
jgi:imidazolonepropionase-like amidohydrolase